MRTLLLLFISTIIYAASLHLTTSSNPSRINPILATDSASSDIATHVFSGLLKYDKDGSNIIGDLAASYTFENNTTLLIKLKENVKWHDGAKFSSRDVVFTYEMINDKQVVSPYTSTFRMVEKVEALDDYTVRITYKKPYFKALETWMMGILPRHLLEDEKNIMNAKFNTAPIGTGPYKLETLEFSKNIILKAFDNYYDGKPKIEKITYHVVADPMTRFLMLKSGKIDLGGLDAMQYERQVAPDFFEQFNSIETLARAYTYLGFNLRLEKFKDPRVREALSLAINRDELVDILFMGHAEVCRGPFFPKGNAFNDKVKAPSQNQQKAIALLKAAGYDTQHPLHFEIATSNSNSIRPYAAQIIQHQLSQVGVEVSLRVMEWQAFLNMVVFPRKFETVLLGWSLGLSPDPYLLWHSDNDKPGAFNFIGYQNAEVDALIDSMENMVDRENIGAIQRDIFAKIVYDNPYLFLFIPNDITVVNKKIKNIVPSDTGIWHNYIEWEIIE